MKKLIESVIAISLVLTTSIFANATTFNDVPSSYWACEYIENLVSEGVLNGYEDGTFKPDANVTNAEFAKMMATYLKMEIDNSKTEEWYENYVQAVSEYFNVEEPNEYANRESIASALVNVYLATVDLALAEPSDEEMLEVFKDANEISDNEKGNILFAYESGVINGYEDGSFKPKANVTRAEVCKMILKADESLKITGRKQEVQQEEKKQEEKQQEEKQQEQQEPVSSNKDFEFDLLNYMPNDENYVISPLSLKLALMLAANGTTGEGQEQILKVLNVEDISNYNEVAKEMMKLYSDPDLNISNSIWLNIDNLDGATDFATEYKNTVTNFYNAETKAEKVDTIVKDVNNWIEEKTNGKITKMLDENEDYTDLLAFLVNTIYFKGEWKEKFEEELTQKADFTDRKGNVTEIDFMNNQDNFGYFEDDTMQMLKMRYMYIDDIGLSMYMVLPKTEDRNLNFKNAVENITYEYEVKVKIPKFKIEFKQEFNDILKSMGISEAFIDGTETFANGKFVNNSEPKPYISKVLQNAFIEVDEGGTEATAATVVIMEVESAMLPIEEPIIKEFIANKPFIYFIMDDETKEVLFLGEYAFAK